MFTTLRANENFHILLWLLKDLCWVMDLRVAGVVMIVPTVAMALLIAWQCRNEVVEFLHAIAVVAWISANGIWMIGEFFLEDGTRPWAIGFFVAGLMVMAWYYGFLLPRRMRFQRRSGGAKA